VPRGERARKNPRRAAQMRAPSGRFALGSAASARRRGYANGGYGSALTAAADNFSVGANCKV
jgi:hypothetical protein